MAGLLRAKACRACAMAKRKCGKQTPQCVRCRRQGIECIYPQTKPSCFVLCEGEDTFSVGHETVMHSNTQLRVFSQGFRTEGGGNILISPALTLPERSVDLFDDLHISSWFSSPETWEFASIPESKQVAPMGPGNLKRAIAKIRSWLAQWVETGSNPFIHSQLYQNTCPECVQDAYTTLSCYLHKSASNEDFVFRIVEDRAKKLIRAYGVLSAESSSEYLSSNAIALDSFGHISRVHSLLIYQYIGLYDGDIRLRHLAESSIPVLQRWMRQMIEHASRSIYLDESIIPTRSQPTAVGSSLLGFARDENFLWHSWILAESIRRTCLIGGSIQYTYITMKQGGSLSCRGGMMFTTRKGAWEAQSAFAWEKMCTEVNLGLMQMADVDTLLTQLVPEDVDDFAMEILQSMLGVERLQQWGARVHD